LKLVIDDACYAYHKIFSEFGEIVAMAGRDIDANSVQDADVLIVRSRTTIKAKWRMKSNNIRAKRCA
jgi:erythronate-4-phosphate dehydrogenase